MSPRSPEVEVDILVQSAHWRRLRNVAGICRTAVQAALKALPRRAAPRGTWGLAIVLSSDAGVRKLNALFRGQDKPTNVLSFPAGNSAGPDKSLKVKPLGDVVVAYGTLAREAREEGKALKAHLTHLVIHGVLHLVGYDHESESDAKAMERLEISILKSLGIANPYTPRTAGTAARKGQRGSKAHR